MKKVIIIGAGPAGLTAGYELLNNAKETDEKYEVTILDLDSQVGGISKTIVYKQNRMDLGGHRFFSKNERVIKFWKDLMTIVKQNDKNVDAEDNIMLVRDRFSTIYYLNHFFDYPISFSFKTLKDMGFSRTLKVICSYFKSLFFKRKENSLEDFYINQFGEYLYELFFEDYTEKIWGRHASKISSDWGIQRVKGVSILVIIKDVFAKIFGKQFDNSSETSLIKQFWYPKYGAGQLWEIVAQKIKEMGGKILLEHEVENIHIQNKNIKSVKCLANGSIEEMQCDICISSIPLKDLISIVEKSSIVPKNISKIAKGLPYRDFIIIGVLLKEVNFKNSIMKDIVSNNWIYIPEQNFKVGRIQIFNNWSPYLLKNANQDIWLGLEYFCNEGDEYWNMCDEDFINFAINELVAMEIICKDAVLDSHIERVKKAYPAYFDTYSQIGELIEFLNSYENLYCVGRNGQHRYNNMDHSMLTAIEAVKNIKGNIRAKSNIWNVNIEKKYIEEEGI